MALFQAQTPVLLELALERSDYEIHPHYDDDGGRGSHRGRAPSRSANLTYLRFRGKGLVSCPETHQPAAVRVAAGKAALEATIGNEQQRLRESSRWSAREGGSTCQRIIAMSWRF